MEKQLILKEFLKLKNEGVITEDFSTYEELLDVLSEKFSENYDSSSDAQEAFDDLDDELDGILNKFSGVYSLGTKEWSIHCSSEASKDAIEELISKWNSYYAYEVTDVDELCSAIEHRVLKDMCNCGCDVHNALAMLCNDVFGEDDLIYVDIGESNPRISFLT